MELHPATVHFPVALLITAGIAWIVGLLRKEYRFWELGFWLHSAGLLGVGLAIVTGNLEIPVDIPEEGQDILDIHQTLGYVIAWLFAMLWIWIFMRIEIMLAKEKHAFTALYWICLSFVFATAWYGGKLVYTFGAGVSQ
jgi:uncharacterized membrane protein